jgi:cation diffusion facilitator family transporter
VGGRPALATPDGRAPAAARGLLTAPRVAGASLAVDCLLVVAKLTAGLLTGSLGLLSDAAHSGLDLVASLFALLAVRAARKPADREHPYGHGRAENLASFGEGVILLLAGAAISLEAGRRLLLGHADVDATPLAIALPAAVMVVETGRALGLRSAGRRWGSPALMAGAQNRVADILASAGVLIGLLMVRLGYQWADAAAALLVAGIIFASAVRLLLRSGDVLIDRAPAGIEEAVRRTIESVDGVRDVRTVRVRGSGNALIGDAHVTARPTLSVEGAQGLSERVLRAVRASHPNLDLSLVVESQSEEKNLVERVHAAAARQGQVRDLHNVTVEREADGSLHLSMHVKLPGSMSLEAAADASAELERRLRQEFPSVSRVDVHLEPLEPDLVAGSDVTRSREDLARQICRMVEANPAVLHCRDVELSARGGGLVAHVVAQIHGGVSLERAHEVETELEEQLRGMPELSEVVARVTP